MVYLSNYATIHIKDAIARVEGVGDVSILGQQDYSMRVWLDPDKLQSRNLTVNDVILVLREQNVQVAAGQIGQPPVPNGQDFQYTLSTLGRLVEAEQFADIILKTGSDGEVTYLRDVSRTDLGARNQDTLGQLDGRPSPGVVVFLLPDSNALNTADGIKAKMRELETRFPKGLRYAVIYDTTPFIRESANEVFHTLRESVILVAIVILLFLQDCGGEIRCQIVFSGKSGVSSGGEIRCQFVFSGKNDELKPDFRRHRISAAWFLAAS